MREKPRAQRVLLVYAPAPVALNATCPRRAVCLLRDAIEQQIAERVGREGQCATAREPRDLHVDITDVLLQRQHRELRRLVLVLIQERAVKVADAVHHEA